MAPGPAPHANRLCSAYNGAHRADGARYPEKYMPLLDWLNKNNALKAAASVPFRLLETTGSTGFTGGQNNDNWLIQGDNLEALKALLPFFAGRVKCIYIDPPYNTKSAFEHYDDNLEHSQWLSMIYPRLELLRELLAEDGSI